MAGAGCAAADIGVERLDAVNESVLAQEIKRTVDGRRRGAAALAAQTFKQVICADRPVLLPDQFQHPPPRRQAQAPCPADFFRSPHGGADAVAVVVAPGQKGGKNRVGGHEIIVRL